ncbi:AcrR family transcriptional regulator [Scopulibacillus daqui]|uniref:AcrR family transcriptional regulator n=1 Tax=Scopulibacillus daqui TaxID=1469162 RepID=A0ABS2PXH8_9BACL|nr:TetR/AcrR family transcriptional regulator [Scopulibacillus daqui]MBM7644571.1 AcrR family transcriptional regulator [Scopulibacillus daqui]
MKKEMNRLSSRKLRSIETKHRLLNAGRDIFIKYGFQKATISQMIKQAQTGYGTAYVHFKNKDDILIVLMEDVMNKFYDIAELPFEPKTKQEAYDLIKNQVRLFLKMARNEQSMMQVIEEAIRVSADVYHKWRSIRERFIQRIAQDIACSQKNGLARTDVDRDLVARGWFFANEMYLWEIVRNENTSSIEDVVHNLTEIYTSGLYAGSDSENCV